MKRTVRPSETNCGPFSVDEITDDVRALVETDKIPIVVHDKGEFAVLAPTGKNLRIICNGCFDNGMSMRDTSKCRKLASHLKHFDLRKKCKTGSPLDRLDARRPVAHQDFLVPYTAQPLVNVSTADLISELKTRRDLIGVGDLLSTDEIVEISKKRGLFEEMKKKIMIDFDKILESVSVEP